MIVPHSRIAIARSARRREWARVPSSEVTKREDYLLKRLERSGKLFAFLREHRLDLFDDPFQEELGDERYQGLSDVERVPCVQRRTTPP
jgi:hypothetical protein